MANITGTVTDYDGNVYNIVRIGDQEWLENNLKATHYADGSAIPADEVMEGQPTETYGKLYKGSVAAGKEIITGWHVPTNAEWTALGNALGGTDIAGDKMKSSTGWNDYEGSSGNGTNESGFNMLPGGYYYTKYGSYSNNGIGGYLWSAESYGYWQLNCSGAKLYGPYTNDSFIRFSVRLVRQAPIPTVEVPDILVAKEGQLHSLRGQTVWKNGVGHTFNSGCGVVKNGILYTLQATSHIDVGMIPVFTKDGLSMDGGQTICSNYPGQALYTGTYTQHVCIFNGMTFMQVWQDDNSIYYTNDKGATWKRYDIGILGWMYCSDNGQVISTPGSPDSTSEGFGNNVFPKISRDGGTTWNELPRSLFHQSAYGASCCFVASDGQHMGMAPRSQAPTATTDGFTSNYIRNGSGVLYNMSGRFFCLCETNPDNTLIFYKTTWVSGANNPNSGQIAFYRNNTLIPLHSGFIGNCTGIESAYGLFAERSADDLHQNLTVLNFDTKVKSIVPRNAIGHLPANSDLIEIKYPYLSNTHIYYTFTLCDLRTKAKGIIKHNLDGRCRLIAGSEEHAYTTLIFNKTFDGFLAISFDGSGILYQVDNDSDFEGGETILKTFPEGCFNATRINPTSSAWFKGYVPTFYRKFQNII